MAKIRVYELARELKMESKTLLAKMKTLGIEVASHQSTLTAAQVTKIKEHASDSASPKVVVRRRRKAVASSEATSSPEEQASMPEKGSKAEVLATQAKSIAETNEKQVEPSSIDTQESVTKIEAATSLANKAADLGSLAARSAPVSVEKGTKVSLESTEKSDLSTDSSSKETAVDVGPKESEKGPKKEEGASEVEDAPLTLAEQVRQEAEKAKTAAEERVANEMRLASRGRDKKKKPQAGKIGKSAQGGLKKGSTDGATIVRKASNEEVEEAISKEKLRQKISKREDSRGTRVTGIGIKTSNIEPGEVDSADREGKGGRKWREKGKVEVRKKFDDEEQRAGTVQRASKRRGTISTRDLLQEDFVDTMFGAPQNRKKKVYTPSSSQKKRDLKRRKDLKSTQITTPRAAYRVIKVSSGSIVVSDLAKQLSVKAGDLIKKLMAQGVMATVNQAVDFDTATLIAQEYGFEVKDVTKNADDLLGEISAQRDGAALRPPIITVMGHVDHGKTSILDAIRKSDVAAGEAGGITQHIGAYTIDQAGFRMTFLDTPGHEAFSAMRARGAKLTDIVVLVVAADDGVMPQTVEAISHAKEANVPIIVAVNKVDKPNKNFDRIYNELAEHGVQSEDWGGDTQFIKCSALKREGIDELLESIQLQAEVLELKAPSNGPATGIVVEAHLDKGRGPVATMIITEGTLHQGDCIVAGQVSGRVRAMFDHNRRKMKEAGPSVPVEIVGLTAVPMSSDRVDAVADEKTAKDIVDLRQREQANIATALQATPSFEDLLGKVKSNELPVVPVIIKGDTQGSIEALAESLLKLNANKKVRCNIVHKAVGGINESDLNLADTSGAFVVGFNVRAVRGLDEEAEKRGVLLKYYSVIYELIDAVKSLMAGKLPPIENEVVQGHAEVRDAISVPKVGVIAGSSVLDGRITRSSNLRLIRDEVVIFSGKIASLRRFKDDVKEVTHGYECGISIDGYNDVRVGDMIEAFMIEETAASLDI